jgi:hypothetical protein
MITDDDVKKLQKKFATKDDLKRFATKDDFAQLDFRMFNLEIRVSNIEDKMATKEDLNNLRSEVLDRMDAVFGELKGLREDFAGHFQSQ